MMCKNPCPKIEINGNTINCMIASRQRKDEFTSEIGWKQGMIMNSLFRDFTHHCREVVIPLPLVKMKALLSKSALL